MGKIFMEKVFYNSKNKELNDYLVVGVRSSINPPYDKHFEECESTWIPLLRKEGYTVKRLLGHPELVRDYQVVGNILFSKATDTKYGIFEKAIVNPCRWFLKETNASYFFIADGDTFVHPYRLIKKLKQGLYHSDYYGAAVNRYIEWPFWERGFKRPITNTHASGGAGFFLSRVAANIIIEEFETGRYKKLPNYNKEWEWYDDYTVGNILMSKGIPLMNDDDFQMESPFYLTNYNQEPWKGYRDLVPYIGDPKTNLCTQHYLNGYMKEVMIALNLNVYLK